ncbi:MAG: ATP-binding protein [Gammaproteobacteria bacterium]|nr:ATP-binding protein [Gammaproteobacteria bacterium]
MTFNADLARQIAFEDIPRDEARYFEGRAKEIENFKHSLNASTRREQAVFRIYQGAPGCGKTSLAAHLARTTEDAVFIKLSRRHLTSFEYMMERIKNAASEQKGRYALTATHWAAASIERLAGRALTEEIQQAVRDHSTEGLRFVLHIDEAHSLPDNALEVLTELHIGGLGETDQIPCVVVLTGLGHTRKHINHHAGLTRAGDGTTMHMTALEGGECAQSTMRMLAELRPHQAPVASRQTLANLSVEWSFGWPRHLLSAQKAICEALLNNNGNAQALNHEQIKERCAELRAEYYMDRLGDIKGAGGDPDLIKRVTAALESKPLHHSEDHLTLLCHKEANETALIEKTIPECAQMARSLIEEGIVERKDGIWALSIPSMGTWATQQLQGSVPTQAQGHDG